MDPRGALTFCFALLSFPFCQAQSCPAHMPGLPGIPGTSGDDGKDGANGGKGDQGKSMLDYGVGEEVGEGSFPVHN